MLAICIVVIVIFIYCVIKSRETFTGSRIIRGVGSLNDADEYSAAGVITSMPLFDYTYTYWDGLKTTSCDDCASIYICPTCPQYAINMNPRAGPIAM